MSKESILLSESKTGGISLVAIFMLLAGLACIGVQLVLLVSGRWAEMEGASGFIAGFIGLLLLAYFAWSGFRKGEVKVYSDRVEGKNRAGKKYSFAMSEISDVVMRGKVLGLIDKDGNTLLADSPPHDWHLRGLIWLMIEHELPVSVWEKYPDADEEGSQPMVRLFLNKDGELEFMDKGLLVEVMDKIIYLPSQDTLPAITRNAGEKSLSTTLQAAHMALKFEPNPEDLPLAKLAAALMSAPLEEKMRLSYFEMLVEAHGGAFLKKGDDAWEGETAGWKVQVMEVPEK